MLTCERGITFGDRRGLLRCLSGYAFGRRIRAVCLASAMACSSVTFVMAQQPPAPPPSTTTTAAPTTPSTPATASASAGLDTLKSDIDAIERNFGDAGTDNALIDLKRRLTPLRDRLGGRLAELGPQLEQIEQRLAQLGAPPVGTATEDAAVSTERSRLTARRAEVDGAVKQAKLLADRADELDERINSRRRELFTNRVFAHSAGLFDPGFWSDLVGATAQELKGIGDLINSWVGHVRSVGEAGVVIAAIVVLLAVAIAALFAARWGRRLIAPTPARRFDKAVVGLLIVCARTTSWSVPVVVIVLVLRNSGLMPSPLPDLGLGLAAAVALAGFGRGVAAALFAPGAAARRIVPWTDREAEAYAGHLTWASRVFGVAVFLNVVHRTLGAPVAPIIVTGALLAFAIAAIAVHLLWRSARADFCDADTSAPGVQLPWFRGIVWLAVIAVLVALVTGYVSFAVFVAGRLLATLAIGGALAIVVVFIDALLTEVLAGDTPRGWRIAALFGLSPRGLDLLETLVSAVLRIILIALAVFFVLGYSGLFAEDALGAFQRATWNLIVGGVNLSPVAILSAFAFVIGGGLLSRRAQHWLKTKILPRTELDAGLQNSILALFGYVAFIALIAIALATLGIDLQKITLIAGALSVGIGFGLQSVVSNFVSGLILLAERPIRVGDWVVVKNEEGWVRRISVRATEIETFDRASVIIPNQEFITGVVKNWTHGNTLGRVVIKVRVAYDSDPATVRALLLGCAERHPDVLKAPPPAVYLMALGDIGLDFELRCLLGNVELSLAIRTDLQTDILRGFREAGIKIPFPAHEARSPGPLPAPPPPEKSPPHA